MNGSCFEGVNYYIEYNSPLTNSFGLDVTARGVMEFDSMAQLVGFAKSEYYLSGGEHMVLSGANNVLFSGDYSGLVLRPTDKTIDIIESGDDTALVRAGAGVDWDDFVQWSVEQQLWGLENLSLIPGMVGAAPIQNIGAYGVEVKDAIVEVEAFDLASATPNIYKASECNFGYRESIFKRELKGRVVVTSVLFRLSRLATPRLEYGDLNREVEALGGDTIENIRKAVISIRQSKLPDTAELGNAGSFFKNPVVEMEVVERLLKSYPEMPTYPVPQQGYMKLAAGWLIDKAGLKGYRSANVGVHDRQALVLVNYGGAKGEEIITFAEYIRSVVSQKFGITIEFEVNII